MPPLPIALVTGASSGIGAEIARGLVARGHAVALAARRADRLQAVAAELQTFAHGGSGGAEPRDPVHTISVDLAAPDGPARLFAELEARNLALDILVNNAGFGWRGRFAESDLERQLEMIRLNVSALTDLTRRALPGMLQRAASRDGRHRGILNVASTAAFAPGPFMAVYYASKAYVESFSVAIAEELRGTNVACTCLCPGPVPTEFSGVAGSENASLFKRATKVTAESVARAGLDGFFRARTIVMPGAANRVVTTTTRLLTRRAAARIVRRIQGLPST